MCTILLLEDNFLNRRQIKTVLERSDYSIIEAGTAAKAFHTLENIEVNLAIIDINLGISSNDGIDFAKEMEKTWDIPYIYLTAYETTEIINAALATTPNSYITKPFKDVDLVTSVRLALKQSEKTEQKASLLIKEDGYQKILNTNDIYYIEAEGNYVNIYTEHTTYRHRTTIKNLLAELPGQFLQAHRAYIINKDKIEKYNSRSVVVMKKEIPISNNYSNPFEDYKNQFL